MKKVRDKYVQVALVLLVLLVAALVPLILIGRYAHPCADDFTYGYYTHAFWSTTHSLAQTLHWALYQVKATYDTWQGTFSSVFLMALSPAIWGEQYYFWTPIIMLTMIIVPHFYFLKKIIAGLLKAPKSIWLIVSSTVCFLMIETMFSPVEGLFWYNGAVHYVFMHGCMILLLGVLLAIGSTGKRVKEILLCLAACFLAVVCGGGNYATALLGILGVVLVSGGGFFLGKRSPWRVLPVAVYGVAFYKNVTAFGNTLRQSNFEKGSPVEAVLDSFAELFRSAESWVTLQILLFLLLMIPFFWKMGETTQFSFPLPLAVTLLSICAVACMYTPGLYAMGIVGAGRTINIIKMWFLLLLFLNEGYWIGYARKRLLPKLSVKLPEKLCGKLFDVRLYVVGILLLVLVSFAVNQERKLFDYSSYAAFVSMRAGEAQTYDQEYERRLEQLTGEESVVYLETFSVKPRLLYFDDIQADPYDWRNTAVARWYGKESVILQTKK